MATLPIQSDLDLKGNSIHHVADGSVADDVATWGQVQALVNGLAWKAEVRAASTANVNLASPGASIDGVTLNNGDRVLLKNQTDGTQNGIYDFHGAASALTRSSDSTTAAQFKAATVLVGEGTANADKAFTQTADNITVGTTALTYVQFGGGSSLTSGNGISISGGAVSVVTPAGSWLVVDGTGVYADKTKIVGKFAATIGDGTSTNITVTHNLGTQDITFSLRQVSDNTGVMTAWTSVDSNTLQLSFGTAPASNSLRVVVHA